MKKCTLVVIALLYIFLNVNMLFADSWDPKASSPSAMKTRYSRGFSIGTKGYTGMAASTSTGTTGTKEFWEYNPATNSWTSKAYFGGGAGLLRQAGVGFSINGKGYMGTGRNGATFYNDFWEYTWATGVLGGTWTSMTSFPGLVRSNAVGFSIGTKGYMGTGWNGTTYYKDFWEYDPSVGVGGTWTQMADFGGAARANAVGFSIGDKGYIGTGYDGTTYYKDFWEYDPSVGAGGTWTQKADFPGPARHEAVGFGSATKGYIGAGSGSDQDSFHQTMYNDAWEYDPATNSWAQKADIGTSWISSTYGFSIGTALYIGYGLNNSTTSRSFLEYNPTSPDPFTFTDLNPAERNATFGSSITVSGLNTGQTNFVNITGCDPTGGGCYYNVNGTQCLDDYNNTGYCVRDDIAVQNGDIVTVTVISSGLHSTTTSTTLNVGGVSGTFSVTTLPGIDPVPGGVAGSGGGCFIATAAFGTPLAGQVEILRQFRDRYLLTNAPGQKFVAWYYRNGPVAAKYIEDKPLIKAAVRVALYPLIGFSLLLISGYLPFVTVGLLLFALLFFRFRPKKLSAA